MVHPTGGATVSSIQNVADVEGTGVLAMHVAKRTFPGLVRLLGTKPTGVSRPLQTRQRFLPGSSQKSVAPLQSARRKPGLKRW